MHIRTLFGMSLLTATLAFCGAALSAHEFKAGDISIGHPWTRVTPTGAKVAGGYLKITNNGREADTLTAATAEGMDTVEVHEMTMKDSVMTMRKLSAGLEIKPGQTVELKPGSFHLMLIGVKAPLEVGKLIKGTLTFAKAGTVPVEFKVEPMSGPKPAEGHH
jgi:periplasmic copper chaperone A